LGFLLTRYEMMSPSKILFSLQM